MTEVGPYCSCVWNQCTTAHHLTGSALILLLVSPLTLQRWLPNVFQVSFLFNSSSSCHLYRNQHNKCVKNDWLFSFFLAISMCPFCSLYASCSASVDRARPSDAQEEGRADMLFFLACSPLWSFLLTIAQFLAVWLVFFGKKIPNISVRHKFWIPNFPFVGEVVVHWT